MFAYIMFLILAIISVIAGTFGYFGFDILAFFLFVIVLATLIYRDRKKVRLEGIIFIRRTQKGRDFIDRTAQSHSTFWGKFAAIGLIVGIPVMLIGSVYLIAQAAVITQGGAEGGVRLLLPGPVSAPVNVPGIFVVPWWIWIIGIAAVVIPHEFMHGIVCRLDKIRIKSVGWILLFVIPGAFVEPDEKQLQKAKKSTRMKVYAAGSFANLVVAAAIIVIFALSFPAFFQPTGIFVNTIEGGPANLSGLQGSITEIDGNAINNVADLSFILAQHKPGDTVNVKAATENILVPTFSTPPFIIPQPVAATDLKNIKEFRITLAEHPEQKDRAYLGVSPQMPAYKFNGDLQAYQNVSMILLWIFIFSFGIGLVNLLPIKPLDGGLLFEEVVGHFTPATKNIVRGVTIVMVFLILFNLIGPVLL
ncbi:MAG: site-2 protease family protein [Candidatus Aenigmarchaeota archaeon]|nr:site-2 protease family protein [Candidatus Aenigmarchaeota archaeon]